MYGLLRILRIYKENRVGVDTIQTIIHLGQYVTYVTLHMDNMSCEECLLFLLNTQIPTVRSNSTRGRYPQTTKCLLKISAIIILTIKKMA